MGWQIWFGACHSRNRPYFLSRPTRHNDIALQNIDIMSNIRSMNLIQYPLKTPLITRHRSRHPMRFICTQATHRLANLMFQIRYHIRHYRSPFYSPITIS